MRFLEFQQEESPRTPTEEDSGGCLFRFLCNPCFWNVSGNSCVGGEKRDQDVSSYYESRVGKIRTRIARVLNGGNMGVNNIDKSGSSGGKVGVCIDKESYLRWKLRKMDQAKNSSESSDNATVKEDEDDDEEEEDDDYLVADEDNDMLRRYPNPQHPARKFICVMTKGMNLQAVVAIGRTKPVLLLTDGMKMQISYSNFTMTVPVDEISSVKRGMSSGKLTRSFLRRDTESSFHIMLRGEQKAATFVCPSTLERDALVHGFQYLLTPMC